MNETRAYILLNFIDDNWEAFENFCDGQEDYENPEEIRTDLEKIALGE